MPAAAPRPETQEEILAAALAARDERDIPAEDDSWVIVDSLTGDRPAELAWAGCRRRPSWAELGSQLAAAAPADHWASGPAGPVAGGGAEGGSPGSPRAAAGQPGARGALAGFADDAHAGLGGLTDDELIGVLRAWRRQASWSQARELAAIAELARRRPADGTPPARPGQLPTN